MEVAEEQHLVARCPVSAVLNNLDLVEKILEGVTDDIRNNMELRFVNKTFRDACHANFRKNHRNLKIEYIFVKTEDPETEVITKNRVYINYRRFSISNVENYLIFLKIIAKVKIQSLVVKNLWKLEPSIRLSLHGSILLLIGDYRDSLKKLIGLDEICPGNCEDCVLIPKECVEHGPLQIENLRKPFTTPRVFEKLIVPDYLLDDIANYCVKSTQSKEDCLKAISDFIPSNISCKTLILKITETRNEWIAPERNDIQEGQRSEDQQALPREVIECMLRQWKIQSVILKFVYEDHRKDYKGGWVPKNWFTILRFTGSRIHINASDPSFKIKEVLLDLTDSIECRSGLITASMDDIHRVHYFDAVSIIRRVFRNDKLKIQFAHYSPGCWLNLSRTMKYMMNKLNVEAPRNLELEIDMYLLFKDDTDFLDELSNQQPNLRPDIYTGFQISNLPNPTNISHKTPNRKDPPAYSIINREWIGECWQMINKENNYTINWTFFTNEDSVDRNTPNWWRHLW